MRPPVLLLPALLLASSCFGEDTAALLTEGQRAYTGGDLETARRDFSLVLELDPSNRAATNYLRMIRVAQPSGAAAGQDAQKQYAAVRLPSVQLREATLGSTLQYLKQALEKQGGGKVHINFVVQLPPEAIESERVTLNLADVPFTEVLRYVGDLAHVTFSFEQYAVVVKGVEASPARPPVQQ